MQSTKDFGFGYAQYKEVLDGKKWQDETVYVFGPNSRARIQSFKNTPIIIADKIARKATEQTGFLLSVKKTRRNIVRADKNRHSSTDSRKTS